MNIAERFEEVDDDYLDFDNIADKKNRRPDIHAFILLSELFPDSNQDIVCASCHDVIWLDVGIEDIEKLTDENIIELTRCGVRYDDDAESLSMFT